MLDKLLENQEGIVSLLVAVATFIAGYSRLESKTGTNTRDIERNSSDIDDLAEKFESRLEQIERKHVELDNRVMEKLLNIERLVARIEGSLSRDIIKR